MSILITANGARFIADELEQFPTQLHDRLKARMTDSVDALWEAVEEVVPKRTGRLASEIVRRVYAGTLRRVAGYVSVYTADPGPAPHNEYAKAASLEYGTSGLRAIRDEKNGALRRLVGSSRRIKARLGSVQAIAPRRYLRGPFESLRPGILASLEEGVSEAVVESDLGAVL